MFLVGVKVDKSLLLCTSPLLFETVFLFTILNLIHLFKFKNKIIAYSDVSSNVLIEIC